jgi:small nuclear ribonucleoprotein (snRNP)-like protein
MDSEVKDFLGKEVVIDTDSRWLYVGTLKKIDKGFLALQNVDAHDLTDTASTRDEYLVNVKTHGLVINRKTVILNREKLIGLSLLEDIIVR